MRNSTVAGLVRHVEQAYGSSVAVEWGDRHHLTVDHLRRRSNQIGHALAGLGIDRQARVAYIGRNTPEFIEIDLGLAKAGLVKVPIYFRLSDTDIRHILAAANVTAVIADQQSAGRIETTLGDLDDILRIVIGDPPGPGWKPYEQLIADASSDDHTVDVQSADLYQIRFTSGTSGIPKGALTTHHAARTAILGNLTILLRESTVRHPRNLIVKPLVLSAGWTVLPTLLLGGTNIVRATYDPEQLMADLVQHGVNWVNLVPTMLRDLATLPTLEPLRSDHLDVLSFGGEPPPVGVLELFLEHTGNLVQLYGQTEAPSWSAYVGKREHRERGLWSSAGRAAPHVTWSVLDNGDAQLTGGTGELAQLTPTVTAGLIGADAEYRERLVHGQWWLTGDIGHIDERGYIFIEGRRSEMIISGGSNVYPQEIERVLEAHPDVIEAAVFGIPHERFGEQPVAVVHANGALTEAALLSWARARLAAFKLPGQIVMSDDRLPRRGSDTKVWKEPLKEAFK